MMVPVPSTLRRVLLVEDEVIVAMYVEDVLNDLGCEVIEIATSLPQALAAAREDDFDFAVLDINLAGETSFPVADVLRERRIPFLFISGYTSGGVTEQYRNEARLRKPFRAVDLERAIGSLAGA